MRKLAFYAATITIALVLLITFSAAASEFFPLTDLRPGMKGIGRTVIQGTTIEEFDVEVIGIVPQSPPVPNLVMVRVSGDVIDRSGGIASGMSGSPVYLDGKLLGAIGYGYAFTDHRVGLVTPAESMLDLFKGLPNFDGDSEYDHDDVQIPDGFSSLSTPVIINGIQGRALDYLGTKLQDLNVTFMPGLAGLGDEDHYGPLEAGSALAVQLLRGDFQAAAFGTVTYVEDDRFVGFGHPFTHKGDVNFFASPAIIHYTMASLEFPFKIASVGDSIGGVYQDRAAGVAGLIGREPRYLPISIHVTDKDRNQTGEYFVESVMDDSLISALAVTSTYQGVDATLDRVGKGTAYVRIEYSASNLNDRIIRENVFYSESDIAVWALLDLQDGLDLLVANKLQKVDLTHVDVQVEIEKQRRTATIEKAVPRDFEIVPGESVDVEVVIRPYRGELETRVLRIDIPADTLPGMMTVTVRSGGSGYYMDKPTVHTAWKDMEEDEVEEERQLPSGGESLENLIDEYTNREKNNEIVAEFYPFIDNFGYPEEEFVEEDEQSFPDMDQPLPNAQELTVESDIYSYNWEDSSGDAIRVRLTTQYVIEGMATFDIDVVQP